MQYPLLKFWKRRFELGLVTTACCLFATIGGAEVGADVVSSKPQIQATSIPSSLDQTQQPIRYFIPETPANSAKPLLVMLHSWSGDVRQNTDLPIVAEECQKLGWAIVFPHFRGPNFQPTACASNLAVQDILDAVAWMEQQTKIDPTRRYVAGASGGGHMTLIMAGRHPEVWAAASAWVPITDLKAWYQESTARNSNYAKNILAVCGGIPGTSPEVDREYRERSPLTHLANSKGLPIDINAGIDDGHTGSVPISHSLRAFNLLADVYEAPAVKFSPAAIDALTLRREVAEEDRVAAPQETFRVKPVLVQRSAGPARVTIFQGGHEGDYLAAIRWLSQHRRETAVPLK